MVCSCSGLMTSTSKAVGHPRLQHEMKMSPGRARGLLGGSQSSGLGSRVDGVTDSIVTGNAISIPPAADLVITVRISGKVAFQAGV